MNEAELERAISKLKARLLTEKGEDSNSSNGEIRKRLVRLQMLRIKLKELEEMEVRFLIPLSCRILNVCLCVCSRSQWRPKTISK